MIGNGNPPIWKIDDDTMIQKYISFKQDDKVFYKSTNAVSMLYNLL